MFKSCLIYYKVYYRFIIHDFLKFCNSINFDIARNEEMYQALQFTTLLLQIITYVLFRFPWQHVWQAFSRTWIFTKIHSENKCQWSFERYLLNASINSLMLYFTWVHLQLLHVLPTPNKVWPFSTNGVEASKGWVCTAHLSTSPMTLLPH